MDSLPRCHWRRSSFGFLAGAVVCLGFAASSPAQTKIRLSTITPGTENVQLVQNGDFQLQGPISSTNTHPSPIGWVRQADMFADPGTNMVVRNDGVVARASLAGGASICQYKRTITLEPATAYVLSGYMWNMGDSVNRVTTVIDMNDATNEPQLLLNYSDPGADQGYFVYRSFNTTDTGPTVTLRVFYDGKTGTGTAAKYYPLPAQWDNVAITKAADFVPPISGGNIRPRITVTSPTDGTSLIQTNGPVFLQITADASHADGGVTNVEFYANAIRIGAATAAPYAVGWSNFPSGTYNLTAVAADNQGARTVSAPVVLTATTAAIPAPPVPALSISRNGLNVLISWPDSLTSYSLQSATNLVVPDWQEVTNVPTSTGTQLNVSLPVAAYARYFRLGQSVDPTTLDRKLMMGYQGWFACPNDGSPMNRWVHWFSTQTPGPDTVTVDFWPDVSEYDADELFDTGMTMPDGRPARVYAAWNQKTVVRHFKWMKDYNLDGVFLQRFTSELSNSKNLSWRNQVTANVRAGAEKYGRTFAIMYDLSGQNESTLVSTVTNDWISLVNTMQITNSPRYIRHHGKPVVAIWGFGFTSRTNTPTEATAVINFFKAAGCTVMGGVPTYWRTLTRDSNTNIEWTAVYHSFDIISPWSVTRFRDLAGADSFRTSVIVPDLADCNANHIEYMPVIFPGFSWHNLDNAYPLNDIPRLGGTFYWRQVYNAVLSSCTMLYGAMYDEMNEGTSMFKMAATPADLPAQGTFVPLNIDGVNLPNDWYLRLADQAGRMLRGDIPLQPQMPIAP